MSSSDNSTLSDTARDASHNTQINTAAAQAHRCGMTHLATGRICLLPERHSGSCDFATRQNEVAAVTPA
jgi:hypothetical protein